jgi:hypothetical protein
MIQYRSYSRPVSSRASSVRGAKELLFWGGVGPPLSRYALPVRAIEVHLLSPA